MPVLPLHIGPLNFCAMHHVYMYLDFNIGWGPLHVCFHYNAIGGLAGKIITDSTWESSQALPMQLVSDYEAGIVYNVKNTSVSAAGQTVHTLSSAITNELPKKKSRKEADPDIGLAFDEG